MKDLIIESVTSDLFKECIKYAILDKLQNNAKMLEEFKKNELTFEHYYFYGKIENPKVHNQTQYSWMMDFLNNLELG